MNLYKVFKKGRKSNHGNIKWHKGKWYHHEGELKLCESGFHASEKIIDAMGYTNAEEIALVEVGNEYIKGEDKYVCRDMRVLKAWEWTKKDSVRLAIFAAELVIDNFERVYPNDKRPREAIEAAKKVFKKDTTKNRRAAWSAAGRATSAAESAAWSAERAASAAESAAESAAWSAKRAARSAERAAWRAAWSATSAAGRATRSAVTNKCEKYILKILREKG